MLKDYIDKYYYDQNFNCAETILHAANECYGLGLSEESMRLVAGYGAGIQTGNVCGAILAAVGVLSMKYVEVRAHDSADIKPATQLLLRRFRESYGSVLCKDIKPLYFSPESRCYQTVQIASEVLDNVIREYETNKA